MQFNPDMMLLAMVVGIFLVMAWIVLILLASAWNAALNWVDDYEQPRTNNPVIRAVMKMLGYSPTSDGIWQYERADGKKSDGEGAIAIPPFVLFSLPFVFLVCVFLYEIPLTLISLYLIARVARFSRRHKKLFDKHLKDPAAHK